MMFCSRLILMTHEHLCSVLFYTKMDQHKVCVALFLKNQLFFVIKNISSIVCVVRCNEKRSALISRNGTDERNKRRKDSATKVTTNKQGSQTDAQHFILTFEANPIKLLFYSLLYNLSITLSRQQTYS